MSTPPTPGEPRPRLPRSQRRALLLEAALASFSENGYHATAMDDIAGRAGVSKPVLYQHFDSKLDLYLALAAQACDGMVETIESAMASTDDNGDRIRATMHGFFAFVDRPGSGYPLVLASDMGDDPSVAALLAQAQTRCAAAVGRVLQDQTDLDGEQSVLIGTALVGLAQSAARHWYESGSQVPRGVAADVMTTVAWRGLGHFPRSLEGAGADAVSSHTGTSG
ncbi:MULTISPECIES: TetR/AcrR family transcriptional regulator [unclassified Ornithinimicrobium]|uniref:TetR/AcrR family transcriptional regulator n=1 Tax=unclassified Ornithinimicrobium TaxID=2615080 RepID=UPI0038542CB0